MEKILKALNLNTFEDNTYFEDAKEFKNFVC